MKNVDKKMDKKELTLNQRFGYSLMFFFMGFFVQSIFLPCLCHEGTVKMQMALYLDVMILLRIIVARCIKEKGNMVWIFYSALPYLLVSVIELSVYFYKNGFSWL